MSKNTQIYEVQRRTIKTQKGEFIMAENLETTTVETETQTTETTENKTPTVEELIAKLAQRDADYAKLKNSFDTTSSELSTAKKQLKAKMSAEEQIEEEKRIADEAKDARIQELESKFRTMDYSKRYMGIGMDEKTAESLSEMTGELADPDKFFSALSKFIAASNKTAGENAVQDLIKKNPEIKSGTGEADKNALAKEKARESANRKTGANMDILKHYIPGGMN